MIDRPFDEAGFLSFEAVRGEEGVASHYPIAFEKLADANATAMSFLRAVDDPSVIADDRDRAIVGIFLVIVIRRYQAAVLLLRRLMTPEAEAIARSGLEATFMLGAYLKQPEETLALLQDNNLDSSRRAINAALEARAGLSFTEAQVATLEGYLASIPADLKAAPISWEAVARRADMHLLYTTLYRQASMRAVHVTERTMARHAEERDGAIGVNFVSDEDLVGPAARTALQILFAALTTVGSRYRVESHRTCIDEIGASVDRPMDDTE